MSHVVRNFFVAIPGLMIFLLGGAVTSAGPILYIDDSSNRLGTVDVGTGAVNVIGSMGGDTMTDIAFDRNGVLYGISFSNLYRINATTAAVTLVGSLGHSDQNSLVFGADGTLYAAGLDGGLYRVNTATGAETFIGNTGFASAGDLAFNGGNLYLSATPGQLVRINLATGAGTAVGSLGFPNVFGLATGDDGVLYGVSGSQIFATNTVTGAGTLVRTYGGGLGPANGTSFFAETSSGAIPEPSSLVLGAIAATLTASTLRLRTHRSAKSGTRRPTQPANAP